MNSRVFKLSAASNIRIGKKRFKTRSSKPTPPISWTMARSDPTSTTMIPAAARMTVRGMLRRLVNKLTRTARMSRTEASRSSWGRSLSTSSTPASMPASLRRSQSSK